ncbi:hypothetical protein [Stenotrophomonas sp. 24(2023)]|uniref:hypothetical protein n=1 Tax=Stenotrophomonas sp. 24(2023) TaxID=3068324 RepID=UPI0027DF815B|nr:hypothetical protein [Stenotrophomonas sp. 24(2023)]WMJ69392.1 hypothetical protein Q9R17_19810 [Stenotrophomonas sp. 24(2023)]
MDGTRWERNRVLDIAAAALLLAVVTYWAGQLWPARAQPAGPRVAPVVAVARVADPAASAPLVRLQSPGAVQTEVSVLGVLASERAPLALLSINGAPAQAYAPGQALGPSTQLLAIDAHGVQLKQAGHRRAIAAPALPALPTDGITPLAAPSP